MAESGAHLTSTLQIKPSIFEVVASDSLNSTFNPAIKKLFTFIANVYPAKYGWLVKYYDELYLILNGFIQQYYLRTSGSSLSEAFYGLTRISTKSNRLTKNVKIISFVAIVLLPYVRIKFEQILLEWKEKMENPLLNAAASNENVKNQHLKKSIITLYNTVKASIEFCQIFQYIFYMAERSKSHTILLKLLNIKLIYAEPVNDDEQPWTLKDLLNGNLRCSTILTSLIFRGLELSAFFLQFIQWWQTEANNRNNTTLTNLPIPKPPKYNINSNKYLGICPICLQHWQIPTAISISGYVYCYKCIIKHFETKQNCPVTNLPANLDDLIRIYEQ